MMFSQLGSALVLEAGAIALALREDRSLLGYYSFLLTHAMASGLFALVVYPLLPAHLRRPRPPVLLLCFALSFFIPFFGVLALWLAVGVMRWLPLRRARNRFRLAPLPELPQSARGDGRRFRELSVRPVLADTGLAVALRTPALNALTSMPVRVVGDLLQRLLVDPAEEMRLVAYGLLDRREKDLRRRIEQQRAAVEVSGPQTPTVVLGLRLRALAELHFELVYQRLVQGDLRRHALEQALQHADQAIARIGAEPGLLQLRARVHLEAGRLEQAQDDLQWAAQMGAPAVRVLPYMAELAYRQGDWVEVRRLLARLEHLPVTPRVAALVRFWNRPGDAA